MGFRQTKLVSQRGRRVYTCRPHSIPTKARSFSVRLFRNPNYYLMRSNDYRSGVYRRGLYIRAANTRKPRNLRHACVGRYSGDYGRKLSRKPILARTSPPRPYRMGRGFLVFVDPAPPLHRIALRRIAAPLRVYCVQLSPIIACNAPNLSPKPFYKYLGVFDT